jgi:hypothetical protein
VERGKEKREGEAKGKGKRKGLARRGDGWSERGIGDVR